MTLQYALQKVCLLQIFRTSPLKIIILLFDATMQHFHLTPLLSGEARENLFLITQPKTWHKQRPQHSDRDVDADTPIGRLYSRSERECTAGDATGATYCGMLLQTRRDSTSSSFSSDCSDTADFADLADRALQNYDMSMNEVHIMMLYNTPS